MYSNFQPSSIILIILSIIKHANMNVFITFLLYCSIYRHYIFNIHCQGAQKRTKATFHLKVLVTAIPKG